MREKSGLYGMGRKMARFVPEQACLLTKANDSTARAGTERLGVGPLSNRCWVAISYPWTSTHSEARCTPAPPAAETGAGLPAKL